MCPAAAAPGTSFPILIFSKSHGYAHNVKHTRAKQASEPQYWAPVMNSSTRRAGIVSRLIASWTLQHAFSQAAKGEHERALALVRKAIERSHDRFLEARLLEAHCHWCLGGIAETIKAFARAREMMEKAKRLSPSDRDYLLRYAMVHFKSRPEISPFRDMELPEAPPLEKVMKRFKTQFPMDPTAQ
jgi:hypothetical protein